MTKPTGKTGANGTPMLVYQDYVAGTDPTDPTSKFSATIEFADGHPVVTWSPKVEDAAFPRRRAEAVAGGLAGGAGEAEKPSAAPPRHLDG